MPFWKQPVRVVLTGLYSLIDQIHGPIDGTNRASVAGGEAVASRLSHLGTLFARCPPEPIPSAIDSMELLVAVDPGYAHSRELLSYAYFCEVMPEARKKHYQITRLGAQAALTATAHKLAGSFTWR